MVSGRRRSDDVGTSITAGGVEGSHSEQGGHQRSPPASRIGSTFSNMEGVDQPLDGLKYAAIGP